MRNAIVETISPNYFQLLSIALRQGRLLSDSDGGEALPSQ